MSVKNVKITQEQADAIERVKQYHRSQLERFKSEPNIFADYLSPLINMEIDAIEKALWGDYEIEPEFKVGDWVVITKGEHEGTIAKIINTNSLPKYHVALGFDEIRHATPEEIAEEKQRRWWAKHGRGVWELKPGDLIQKLCSVWDFEAQEVKGYDGGYVLLSNTVKISPSMLMDARFMNANFRVLCFADDRKDLK